MDIIEPITITDAILTASNVNETDESEWDSTSAYAVGAEVMIATTVANTHKTYECLVSQSAGLTADLLSEDCSAISDWTDGDTGVGGGVSEVSPAGQFRFDTNISAAGNYLSARYRTITSPPNTHTIEIKTYFDALGAYADIDAFQLSYYNTTWQLRAHFCSDGLFIFKAAGATGEVGTNIVKCNATAAWQTWRFEVTKTVEADATVTVYLKEEGGAFVSQGTVDCDYATGGKDGRILLVQYGSTTDNMVSHVDYVKVATGLGVIKSTADSPIDNTDWLEVDSTNRWKAFNGVLGSQTEKATLIQYVLTPGEAIDSVALLNLESDTVDIYQISTSYITNGTVWTGASGTTQPTGWDKKGTPSDYTIDGGTLRITADAAAEGISQTINFFYNSNFSAGVDSFSANLGAVAGNIDGIGGQDNCLRFTCDATAAIGSHYMSRGSGLQPLVSYSLSFKYYIPSTNSNIDGISMGGESTLPSDYTSSYVPLQSVTDAWTTVNITSITAPVAEDGFVIWFWDGNSLVDQDAGGDDVAYFKDFVFTIIDGQEFQVLGQVKATSGDTVTWRVEDATHTDTISGANITSTVMTSFSSVFTLPASCKSITIYLQAAANGDIVWVDNIFCCKTVYSETITTGTTKTDVVKTDLYNTSVSIITINVNKSGTAAIGELIIGNKIALGTTLASPAPKVGIEDYSSQSQDTFGNWTIVQRGYAKKLTLSTKIEATSTLTVRENSDYIFGVLSACRSLMRVWIGDEDLSCMIVYGKYNSFDLTLAQINFSLLDLDILGMI